MFSALNDWLFGSGLEPHGYCLLWEPGLIWLYAISDGLIALAYFSIPLALIVIGRKRSDLVFRPLLGLFAAFILLCGSTHMMDLLTLWTPLYGLQGILKAATAAASVSTALALWWVLPHFLSLPSTAQLQEANAALRESEERLAHAQKMEAIGRLTGGVAHDFNNLIQVIVGSLQVIEVLIQRGRGTEIGPALAAIRKATNNASSLINRMLAFSRRQTLLPRLIAPDALVLGLEEILRRTLGPDVELELRLGHCRQWINCDSSQLESALLNLAINSRDAMPHGGVLQIVTADRTLTEPMPDPDLEPGDYVEIEVVDNGCGMSEDVLNRVFEPFFTTKATGRGTGLGLSQIYGFVKQSGGFVQIDSRQGQGTSVHIFLPGHDAPAIPAVERKPAHQNVTLVSADSQRRILLVEDQPDVRAQIADVLEQLGCTVIQAGDGVSGLEMLKSHKTVDLLITDIGLPGLSGTELAEAARDERPYLPILLITGYAGASLETMKIQSNIEVLRKPFAREELTARVHDLLRCKAAPQ